MAKEYDLKTMTTNRRQMFFNTGPTSPCTTVQLHSHADCSRMITVWNYSYPPCDYWRNYVPQFSYVCIAVSWKNLHHKPHERALEKYTLL